MESYIVINGKKAPLTEEQLKMLGIETEKKSPFKRIANKNYYAISGDGKVWCYYDNVMDVVHDNHFEVANYCTDKDLLQQRAWYETLNRLLWRYSIEHDGDKIKMSNDIFRYGIKQVQNKWSTYPTNGKLFGAPMFYSKEIAESAIEEVVKPFMEAHPDFVW